MRLETILAATGNTHKIAEIRSLLEPYGIDVQGLPAGAKLPPETGRDFRANALIKARYGYTLTGRPTLADDSGLEVEALAGAPGVHSARYGGPRADAAVNNRKLLRALAGAENRRARFCCAILLVMGETVIEAEGYSPGLILETPRGEGGFGYDPLFYLPELGKTMAELTPEEKNAHSHRGQALAALVATLRARRLVACS